MIVSRLNLLSGACAVIAVSGCANRPVYLHDAELATAAAQAQAAFKQAQADDLWTTMSANLDRSGAVERELLARTFRFRFEGQLQDAQSLTWGELQECADGTCFATLTADAIALSGESVLSDDFAALGTSEKIAAVAGAMAEIGEQIEALADLQAADPSGATETGMLSPVPSSSVATSIAAVGANVDRLEEKLSAAKREKLDALEEAIDGLVPRLPPELADRRARIRDTLVAGIGELRAALERVAPFEALAGAATTESERMIAAAGISTADAGDILTQVLRNVFDDLFEPIDVHIDATSELLTEAESLVATALGENTPTSERLTAIADVLRKSEHLDFLKSTTLATALSEASMRELPDGVASALGTRTVGELVMLIEQRDEKIEALAEKVSLRGLFDDLRDEPLSPEFAVALGTHTGKSISSVGALLDYLGTDESRLQEVRVALLNDWRRSVVEARALELESLRYHLGLTEKLGRALAEQRRAEEALASQLRTMRPGCLTGLQDAGRVFDTLDALAQGSTLRFNSGDPDCAENYGTRRAQFENVVGVLGDYFRRIGYLHDNEQLARHDLVQYAHRRSIDESRVAADAYERFVEHGLQGLVAFTQGGITTEQVAAVLRFVNVGLLNEIANQQ